MSDSVGGSNNNLKNVKSGQLEVFREIGNIGAGNAATALASILSKRVDMSVPEVEVVPFNTIVNILNGPETLVAGVLVDMTGDLNGSILLVMEMGDATEITSLAMKDVLPPPGTDTNFGELEISALVEISNILVGSFISAISTFTNLRIIPSTPQLAIDMLGAIMSIVTIEYGKMGDSVLFLETQFSDVEKTMSGHFFLIPDYKSYKILLESLGMGD